ncbi:MAG: metallophosphoesterase family protein [Nitrospirae bacterium]|nr:metallophosphoesterase family protein [Nitrospirota bacterium]
MPYAVISDVHSNLEALDAVMEDIRRRGIGRVLFLGDAVGYGPDPNGCIELLDKECEVMLAGNHDRAVTGDTPIEYFNENARAAVIWTQEHISEENLELLRRLDIIRLMEAEDLCLVHSTPRRPEAWHYIVTLTDAAVNFQYFEQKICLLGHSHSPFMVEKTPSGDLVLHRDRVTFSEGSRYIINVGSVGQPRDGDPRAAYAVLSSDGAEIVRIGYDIGETQRKMREAGLPRFLIERLQNGI